MPLTGDDAALVQVINRVGRIPAKLKREGLRRAGYAIQTELLREFTLSRAPSGAAWLPLKWRKGHPLELTYKLRESWKLRVGKEQFVLLTTVPYALPHQYGANYGARVNRHTKRGRFKSKKSAGRFKEGQKRGVVRVSFAKPWRLPARPMIPLTGAAPARWRDAITRCFREAFEVAANG